MNNPTNLRQDRSGAICEAGSTGQTILAMLEREAAGQTVDRRKAESMLPFAFWSAAMLVAGMLAMSFVS
ncbi:MAG TPA: hypothetical protein VK626_01685 [Nitrospiraceae bacterium]|nr:hypothetical protein [Nitrospiraceae bacterium]